MAIGVIDFFEPVGVQHQQDPPTLCLAGLFDEIEKSAPVVQPCKPIFARQLQKLALKPDLENCDCQKERDQRPPDNGGMCQII